MNIHVNFSTLQFLPLRQLIVNNDQHRQKIVKGDAISSKAFEQLYNKLINIITKLEEKESVPVNLHTNASVTTLARTCFKSTIQQNIQLSI